MMVRYEIVELENDYIPQLDTVEACTDFFESIGAYALRLSEENGDGLPVVCILPIDCL